MKICFTTNNAHKLLEVKEILGDSIELLSLSDIGFEGDIPETHETLEENSLEKAQYIFQKYRIPVFSDDSGLEVVALNGKPGVHTAHYAGSREARFRAVITYIDLEGKEQQFEGIVDGQIAPEMSGAEGFGYDPIFIPLGYEKTFAELSSEVKNTISHRKRALEKLVQFLKSTT